jgi:hypothetical protein
MGQQKWSLTPEDMGPVVWALELMIDEINEDLVSDYGIQAVADRIVWKTEQERVAGKLTDPTVARLLKKHTFIQLPLTADEAPRCGYALLVAANRLDHFAGVEGLRGNATAEDFVLPYQANESAIDLVRRHFGPFADDIAWIRQESLRLRLHAHRLLEHED